MAKPGASHNHAAGSPRDDDIRAQPAKAVRFPKPQHPAMGAGDVGGDGKAKPHAAALVLVARRIKPRERPCRLVPPRFWDAFAWPRLSTHLVLPPRA